VRRTERRWCLFIEKQGRDKIKNTGTARKVPKMVKTDRKLLLVNGESRAAEVQ
jgi:hypothetical protein